MTENSTIDITREFDATRQRVWDAWTDSAKFAQWMGTEPDRTTLEVRVGGRWSAAMVYEGNEIKFWGEYREISEPERLVKTFTDSPDGYAIATVTLTEKDGKTEQHFTQVGPMPPEQIEPATAGWVAFFDQLEQLLKS